MRFDKIIPSERLKPYVRYFAISEDEAGSEYKGLPFTGTVLGFQYSGGLAVVDDKGELPLATAGITGIKNRFTIFKNNVGTRTILIFFTEPGLAGFTSMPAHKLFNQSISLDAIFDRNGVGQTEEGLAFAKTDSQRIRIVEQFLLSNLRDIQTDTLIVEAVKCIYGSKGTMRLKELTQALFISQSPFEKRFRKVMGTTPKKFASIVRFNAVLNTISSAKPLTDVCYENSFFDQAHFIRDFKQYTGKTPEQYKRFL